MAPKIESSSEEQHQEEEGKPKKLEAVVHIMVGYQCPNPECGEQLGGDENLELNKENGYRAEITAGEVECPFCKTPVYNRKYVVKGF